MQVKLFKMQRVGFGKPAEFILETFLRRLTLLYPLGEVLLLLLPLMLD